MVGPSQSDAKTRSTLTTFGLLLVIMLVGMGLRLCQLDTDSLWLDEVKTASTSRLDFVSMLNFQVDNSIHPPLQYVLNHWFIVIVGTSDFAQKLAGQIVYVELPPVGKVVQLDFSCRSFRHVSLKECVK